MKQQEPPELLHLWRFFWFYSAYTRLNLQIKLWKSPCIAGMANPAFISFRFGDRGPVSQLYLVRRLPEIAAAVARVFLWQTVQGKGCILTKRRR